MNLKVFSVIIYCNNSISSDNNKVPLLCYEEFKGENRQDLERNRQETRVSFLRSQLCPERGSRAENICG